MTIKASLSPLIDRAWSHYHDLAEELRAVSPAMPILFFGNLDEYVQSSPRIITAALNPSWNEFPAADPALRFSACRDAIKQKIRPDDETYIRTLSDYFVGETAYTPWFNPSYRVLLEQFSASLDSSPQSRRALHTDVFSPIATSPAWTGLKRSEKETLYSFGLELWQDLVEVLKPDLVLLSFGKYHLPHVRSISFTEQDQIELPAGVRPGGEIRYRTTEVSGTKRHWVWGSAGRKPFLKFNEPEKRLIGAKLNRMIFGGG